MLLFFLNRFEGCVSEVSASGQGQLLLLVAIHAISSSDGSWQCPFSVYVYAKRMPSWPVRLTEGCPTFRSLQMGS